MTTTLAILLLVPTLLVAWLLTFFGAPGNWLLVLASAIYKWLGPVGGRTEYSWTLVLVLLALAALGELLELIASAFTTRRAGASRRSAVFALVGSIAGGLLGLFISLPIPIVGLLLGPILFAAGGAMAGAMWSEYQSGRSSDESWKIGQAAFWGRFLGTGAKVAVGGLMLLIAVAALVI